MMTNPIIERIQYHFTESIQTQIDTADTLISSIGLACEKIIQSLLEGRKILCCGVYQALLTAMFFEERLLNRFQKERPSLPVILLTTSSLRSHWEESASTDMYAKQCRALGGEGDVLLVISEGHSAILMNTIKAAHDRGMWVCALTGQRSDVASILNEQDLELSVPSFEGIRVQEAHLLIIHSLCDTIDHQLFGYGEKVK